MNVEKDSVESMTMKIMKELKKNFFDVYQLQAIGDKNIRAAEKVACNLCRWIIIQNIDAKKVDVDKTGFLCVYFERSYDF